MIATIDPAALRRFTDKLEFLPLTAAQRQDLFIRSWPAEMSTAELGEVERRLGRMHGVTPGDIAVVAKQNRLRRTPMLPEDGLDLVAAELSLRGGSHTARMGFLA